MKYFILQALKHYARPLAKRFMQDLKDPKKAQEKVLKQIVKDLKLTSYGKNIGVHCIDTFKRKAPIVTYDDLEPWIAKQKRCEMNVLVNGKVEFYEKTSGSTGPSKYIPYTKSLRSSFRRMFLIWAYDILQNIPKMGSGKLYFSVSPSFDEETLTEAGVKVGLEDDADYLGRYLKTFISPFLLTPEGLRDVRRPDYFKELLCVSLIAEESLEAISIWNPSFLRVLMEWVGENQQMLIEKCAPVLSRERLDALSANPIEWTKLWPNLKLISTWGDAHARSLARELAQDFPGVVVQPKGLLSTEAPMTIPLIGVEGGVPLINEVFFEFLDEQEVLLELCDLEIGSTYEIVVSQRGGLVRYRLGDYVRVLAQIGDTPTFEFVGRGNSVSDLVGEKLSERFVKEVLETVVDLNSGFHCLIPSRFPKDGYVFVASTSESISQATKEYIETKLCQAYHYRHARALGQLLPVRVVVEPRIETLLSEFYLRAGKRWGDMKSTCLLTLPIDSQLAESLIGMRDEATNHE